ncbi:hypothetical protein ACT3SZ_04560 [Corynebacterium sp. AOP40-9SA-29]|uniref:hypothetical protein n=1 Tax=Corynebacterium sp. AOP40-9SA-29 TaxID=3457677 RepID=UPI0040345F1E
MRGPGFAVRVQMYPRIEQLMVLTMLGVSVILLLPGQGTADFIVIALTTGFGIWMALPDVSRYRAFGVPLAMWRVDAMIAGAVVLALFIGVAVLVGGGTGGMWGIAGALLGALVAAVMQAVAMRPLLRGDRTVQGTSRSASTSWTALVAKLPASWGPLSWRLIHLPALSTAVAVVVTFVVVIGVVTAMISGGDEPIEMAFLLAPIAIACSGVVDVLAGTRRSWAAYGLPVRRWLVHAHVASAAVVALGVACVAVLVSSGALATGVSDDGWTAGRIVLVTGLLLLLIVLLPMLVTVHYYLGFVVLFVLGIALTVMLSVSDFPGGPLPVVAGVVVIAAAGGVLTYCVRKVLAGDDLHPVGAVQGDDRLYYQRQGAL